MIVPSEVSRKHENVRPYLSLVEGAVKDVLRGYADASGFAFMGRLKETGSIAEKIESGRFASWNSLDDLYACCLVVPTLKHEPLAVMYLEKQFELIEIRDRGSTQKDPAIFRFDATRFIGRIGKTLMPNASADVQEVRFEVQVRTAFEHAWSSTTHALAYKGGKVDWRRLRLAAQLKAAVEQLDALISGYDLFVEEIAPQRWPEVEAKRQIETYFRDLIQSHTLPSEFEPDSWLRFCENFLSVVIATKNGYVENRVEATLQTLGIIGEELAGMAPHTIPRSLSLLQFCTGLLARKGAISRPLRRYTPLITKELTDLFPETRVLGPGFRV